VQAGARGRAHGRAVPVAALLATLMAAVVGGGSAAAATGQDIAADGGAHRSAVLWPLTATPHLTATPLGAGPASEPVFDNDALAEEFAGGGRLRQVVEAGKDLAVTWLIDPNLVIEAQTMADGYRIADGSGEALPQHSTKGAGGDAAKQWLAELKQAVRDRHVILLPYADTDLASLAHHAAPGAAQRNEIIADLTADGRQTVDKALGTDAEVGLAWPVDGVVDSAITSLAARLGLTSVLTSGQGLEPGGPDPVALDNRLTALPYGPDLTSALAGIPSSSDSPSSSSSPDPAASTHPTDHSGDASSAGRIKDLLKAYDRPVVVPPRELSGAAARALAKALGSGVQDRWLRLTGLDEVSGDAVEGQAAAAETYPQSLRKSELTPDRLAAVAANADGLATLQGILTQPQSTTDAVHAAMARAVSAVWRHDPAGEDAYQRRISAFLSASASAVRLTPKTTVILSPGSANLPITVDNGLHQEVGGLEIRVASGNPARLQVRDTVAAVTARGSAKHTARIGVNAHHGGKAMLTVRLYTTADSKPWGGPMTFEADVTPVSTPAVAIVLAGIGLVVAAVFLRAWRIRRNRI
jgi:hypothetical protein